MPGTKEAAEDDEFAEMVGGVVGDEESFTEEILSVAPAEGLVKIDGGTLDEGDEVFEIAVDLRNGVIPGVGAGRLR